MGVLSTVVGIGGAILGAKLSSDAAKGASKQQARSADAAVAETRAGREQAFAALSPFREAGQQVLDPLLGFVSEGPESEFERTQGFEAIQKSAAAGGKLQSGQTLKALTEFSAGINQKFRTQRFNELFQLANLGQSSAASTANVGIRSAENVSNLLIGKGNVQAAGTVGAANAINTGINQLGSFLATLKK